MTHYETFPTNPGHAVEGVITPAGAHAQAIEHTYGGPVQPERREPGVVIRAAEHLGDIAAQQTGVQEAAQAREGQQYQGYVIGQRRA